MLPNIDLQFAFDSDDSKQFHLKLGNSICALIKSGQHRQWGGGQLDK